MYRVTNVSRAPRPFKGVNIFPGKTNSVLFEDKDIDAFHFKLFGFRIEKISDQAASAKKLPPETIETPIPVEKEEVPKKMKEWIKEEEEKETEEGKEKEKETEEGKEKEKETEEEKKEEREGTLNIGVEATAGTVTIPNKTEKKIEKTPKTTKKKVTKRKKLKRKKKS